MKTLVHTSIILDTRRALRDGTFPVKLRLTYLRERKYYPTEFNLTREDFSKSQSEKPKGKYKKLQLAFQSIELNATSVIDDLSAFTFEEFEKALLRNPYSDDVFATFTETVEKLRKEGRAGTADSYRCASDSILSFIKDEPVIAKKGFTRKDAETRKANKAKKPRLPFYNITVSLLKEYEAWMVGRGKSLTTVGIYLRALRAIYNEAIECGIIHKDLYPFGKRKYQIPASRNIKKALDITDIGKIFRYEPKNEGERRARDMWIFSYLCNGINIKDITRLKYSNLDDDKITFIRSKTERTSRHNLKPIVAARSAEINQIIERWGCKPLEPKGYVFPLLEPNLSPEQELAKVRQVTKTINDYMKRIATELGIQKGVTTYTARHSYSTVLKRAGASMEFISESLGHSNLKTTENYLDSFEDNVKRKFSSALTDFPTEEESL